MKTLSKLNFIAFASLLMVFTGCQFSVGTNKDLKTGLSTSYNGFKVNEVYLADMDRKPLSSNKVAHGSTIYIVASGVENYTLKEGKAYPGCKLTVTEKGGKLIGTIPDVMAEISKNGLEPDKATLLSTNIDLNAVFTPGKTYHISVLFFDKQNAKSKITADVDIEVQ